MTPCPGGPVRSGCGRNRRCAFLGQDRRAAHRPLRGLRSRANTRLAEMARGAADQKDRVALALESERRHMAYVLDSRRRRSRASAGSPRHWSRCRASNCRRRRGSQARGSASPMPSMEATISPMISGFSGLPKLRLSVTASGIAPTAVILRQAFRHRLLGAFERIGFAIARRDIA